jgi:cytochrome c biogenesis protein CcmG, thiol:disulfide interchange protein DsbE
MTQMRQWTIAIGVVMALGFSAALAIKIRPQLDRVGAGSRAPAFQAINLRTGRPASLADYRGMVILLNVWATWCEPCRLEMPSMQRLHARFGGGAFRVVAVSIDEEDSSRVSRFAEELGITFDILHDRPGAIQRIYRTTGVPETFLIDREGTIVKKVIGAAAWDGPEAETLVRKLIDAG